METKSELLAGSATSTLQLVTFMVGTGEYAVDIGKVQEINRYQEVTKIPNSPEFMEGVINLRGKVMSVINLSKVFGLAGAELKDSKIMITDVRGTITGLIVDNVSEVLRIPSSIVEPPPAVSGDHSTEIVRAIAKLQDRLLMLLDIDLLLSADFAVEPLEIAHN